MGHQHRHGHVLEDVPGRAAQDELAYARVPVRAHHDEIGAEVRRPREQHVAEFLAEVLGGPQLYSTERGGHPNMIRHHLTRSLTHEQRRRWIELLLACGDEIGIPDDPEFRSAFVGYLEWGTRLAVLNSQPGATVTEDAPMPRWGWGEVGGPYVPKG